jgi:hypothetical protein
VVQAAAEVDGIHHQQAVLVTHQTLLQAKVIMVELVLILAQQVAEVLVQ